MRRRILGAALLLAGMQAHAAQPDLQAWCTQFATHAVQQYQLLISHPDCHVFPSPRWQPSYANHYAGCMAFPRKFNESEDAARSAELERCGITPPPMPTAATGATAGNSAPAAAPAASAPAAAVTPAVATPAMAPAPTTQAPAKAIAIAAGSRPTLRTLHTFSTPDGGTPMGALVEAPDGSFYGITTRGGLTEGSSRPHAGTVFRITPAGSYATVYAFSGGADGAYPTSLVLGGEGNLYGTTRDGAAGGGTLFRLTPGGALTTLHTFDGADGEHPGGLIRDKAGVLYGSTLDGPLFKFTPGGAFSRLPLSGVNDCGNAALALGPDGYFYVTCGGGGDAYSGEIIKVSTSGAAVRLHAFTGPDGRFPRSPLALGGDGFLYGITTAGGLNGLGTIFRITPKGELTVIRQLGLADGLNDTVPLATLLPLPNDHLLGAGPSTIVDLAPDGSMTTLYALNNGDGEGMSPNTLVQGRDGRFYATTSKGGTAGMGTLFHLAFPKSAGPQATATTVPIDASNTGSPATLMKLDALRTPGRFPDRFYLGGIWVQHVRMQDGHIVDVQFRIFQEDDEFHICAKQNEQERCFGGTYGAHASSVAVKAETVLPGDVTSVQTTLLVKDPDHLEVHERVGTQDAVLYYARLSAPEPDDAPCDPQNSSHTTADFAFERARASYHRNDAVAAACWNHVAAMQGYARSQGLLSAMLEAGEGVAVDYAAAFTWASKAADQGHFLGEIMLSRLYHFGHGVAADEARSSALREKGMAGYRAYLQTFQSKGSPWERLSPAQKGKIIRLTSAILDTWAGASQQEALLDDVKRSNRGISDDAARAIVAQDPDYQEARRLTSSGFETQLDMILGVDAPDSDEARK